MSVQCGSRAAKHAEQPAELDTLPDELLAKLMRSTGVQDALACLPHNSRLHRAWQTAVEELSISDSKIDEKDIQLIKKYTNLKRLELEGIRTAGIPAWNVASEASCLEKLVELSVSGCEKAAGVLAVVVGTCLRNRLQVLKLEEEEEVRASDLSALGTLTALRTFSLVCKNIHYSNADHDPFSRLRAACAAPQSLRELSITSSDGVLKPPLASVFPGSLTGLTSLDLSNEESHDMSQEDTLVPAVSRLVNLQMLNTNYELLSTETQQQALGKLARLTSLILRGCVSEDATRLHPQPQLSLLQELAAAEYLVCNPFVLRSLRKLEACGVEVPEAQRGAVLQAWPLQELELYAGSGRDVPDVELQGFPTVPSLTTFRIYSLSPSEQPGRYLHLASMLHRHAGHLQDILLHLTEPYLEPFPALPACKKLKLTRRAVGPGTLALLRGCALPALEELHLEVATLSGVQLVETLQQDLSWLAGLPALCSVRVEVKEPGLAEAQAALVALLPGKQVEAVRAHMWSYNNV